MTLTLLARRTAAIVLGAGGVMLGLASPAVAVPPGCTVADFTNVATGVNAATTAYLFTHPDVNAFFTGLQGQPKDSVKAQVEAYLQANPQVREDLKVATAAGDDLRARCGVPDEAVILGTL